MKAAGWLAIVVALILGGVAIAGSIDDSNQKAERIQRGFNEINHHEDADFQQDMADATARDEAENHEWLGAAAALIVGLALIAAGRKRPVPEAASPASDVYACPVCAETIKRAALKCRYCTADLAPPV